MKKLVECGPWTVNYPADAGCRGIWTTTFTMFNLQGFEGLWDIACNQQADLRTDVRQVNPAQVGPQINVFLGRNIVLCDGYLGSGVEDW